MRLLLIVILLFLIIAGLYFAYTQFNSPFTVQDQSTYIVTKPVPTTEPLIESDDQNDLTALERDLLELDNLETDLQEDVGAL